MNAVQAIRRYADDLDLIPGGADHAEALMMAAKMVEDGHGPDVIRRASAFVELMDPRRAELMRFVANGLERGDLDTRRLIPCEQEICDMLVEVEWKGLGADYGEYHWHEPPDEKERRQKLITGDERDDLNYNRAVHGVDR